MIAIDASELWRQIPPEEKLDMLAQAHAKGIFSAAILIIIGCTLAVGLKIVWLMWASIIASPLVFQFASGKAWRGLRPKAMLEYLAARSAARRFAFSYKAEDLGLNMIFKGRLKREFGEENIEEELEATAQDNKEADVWVALFNDVLIMISERPGGAELQFGHLVNDKLEVESSSPASGKEYANDHEVRLSYIDKKGALKRYRLTSRHPGALIVFEKRLRAALQRAKERDTQRALMPPPENASEGDDLFAAFAER